MVLAAVLLWSAAVAAVPAQQERRAEPLVAAINVPAISTVGLPFSDGAGILSGGLVCIPSGRLHVSDFVRSEAEFRSLVDEALQADQNLSQGVTLDRPRISITLKAVNAKLCARGYGVWGMGDRRSLSGKSKFLFDWTYQVSTEVTLTGTNEISVDLKKADAQPVGSILPIALRLLTEHIKEDSSAL